MLKSVKPPLIEPRPYKKPPVNKHICTFDTETDPFGKGLTIAPFTCGFYDGEDYVDFWGDDCIKQFAEYLQTRADEELLIYCHNLGGFDIHFLHDYFDDNSNLLIIGRRIAKATILGQEWRDSYKLTPVPLADHHKIQFDYNKMLRSEREKHKEEILFYQKDDCLSLYQLVTKFLDELGDRITIGNAAINMLQDTQGFQRLLKKQDAAIRPYFYGGRVQCFERGLLHDDFKIYDVNSMYPFIMATVKHPISATLHRRHQISEKTAFAHIIAINNGCLPSRGKMDLSFSTREGEFWASIHEIKAGLECGTLRIIKVLETIDFSEWADFSGFIFPLYQKRLEAKASGDKLQDLYYKLMMNNAYGKFCQDPEKYADSKYTIGFTIPMEERYDRDENPGGWLPAFQNKDRIIWTRTQSDKRLMYYNVATGASITGAARAYLHRAICRADRPVYCDTDSIICRNLDADINPTVLGAWKLEATGNTLGIAGKKVYALMDDEKVVKKASKGVGLTALEILRVAEGEVIEYHPDVPTFTLDGKQEYVSRTIKATG